jgi:peptidoglycan/LPS O-acetylase OafA/YrhL
VLLSFFQLSNIAPILGITMVNGAMWSLSVEEHFYLCWPFIVRKLNVGNVALVAGIVWVAEPVIRGIAFPHVATVFPYSWFRLDGIASGALIACFVRSSSYSPQRARKAAIVFACVGVLIEIAGSPWSIRQHQTQFGAVFEYPPVNMVCAGVVLWGACLSGLAETRILRLWPLRIFGDLSYCLYLTHMMVMDAYDALLKFLGYPLSVTSFHGVVVRATAVLVGSFIIAVLSRRYLERPAEVEEVFPVGCRQWAADASCRIASSIEEAVVEPVAVSGSSKTSTAGAHIAGDCGVSLASTR